MLNKKTVPWTFSFSEVYFEEIKKMKREAVELGLVVLLKTYMSRFGIQVMLNKKRL